MSRVWVRLLLCVGWLFAAVACEQTAEVSTEAQESQNEKNKHPLMQKLDQSIERQICLEVFGRINREELQSQQNTLSEFVPGTTDAEPVRQKYLAQALGDCVLKLQSESREAAVHIAQQLVSESSMRSLSVDKLPPYFQFTENIFHKGLTDQTELEEEMLNTLVLAYQQFREQADKRRADRKNGNSDENDSQDLETLKSDYQQLFEYIKSANTKIQWDTTVYATAGILFGFIMGTTIAGVQHWRKTKLAIKIIKETEQDDSGDSKPEETEKRWAALKKQKDLILELKCKIAAARSGAAKPKSD